MCFCTFLTEETLSDDGVRCCIVLWLLNETAIVIEHFKGCCFIPNIGNIKIRHVSFELF